ncbi:MAG: ABC transporter ATP-binding protein, partial [Pseudomonadota bacterium]
MPKIVFEGVEKSFGSVRVLPPVDLTLEDSEFTVLVGPSGCGKSTTLRILAGLETLSGGEIFFDGKPISKLEPKERDIAMVFQDYALYPHMNIARNMSFALRLSKRPKAEITEKVQRVADMLNIGHLLDRKPAELSGGQRQRVAMGRALVRDAGTFLFDEPLSNLDAKLRAKMRTELAEMRDTIDKNMVYVTHDQVEAMTLGDRIVVMSEGVVQQQGTPEELFKTPVNKFVAGFIGSPTMNFVDGALSDEGGKLWVKGDGYR